MMFEPGAGYERYMDYALDVPMYFVMRNGQFINCAGESFRSFSMASCRSCPVKNQ